MHYLHGFLCKKTFFECADLLLSTEIASFDTHGARHVLARNSLCRDTVDMHGKLLAKLLEHSAGETQAFFIDTDAHLLAEYMHQISAEIVFSARFPKKAKNEKDVPEIAFFAMQEYEDETWQGLEFIRVFLRTSLELQARDAHKLFTAKGANRKQTPLDGIIASLQSTSGVHPALVSMVINRLANPTDVLNYLADYFSDKNESLDNKAFCTFVGALRPLVANGHWYPENGRHYAQLWSAHALLNKPLLTPDIDWDPAFVRAMLHGRPDLLHHALAYVSKVSHIPLSTMDAFFPLPLHECNRPVVLREMAHLVLQQYVEPTREKAEDFLGRLEAHHPDIMQLLHLHFSLSSTPEDASLTSKPMMEAFDQICEGKTWSAVVETIDPSVFDKASA